MYEGSRFLFGKIGHFEGTNLFPIQLLALCNEDEVEFAMKQRFE